MEDENKILAVDGTTIGYYKYKNQVVDGGGIPVGFFVESMDGVKKFNLNPDGTVSSAYTLFSGTTTFYYNNGCIYHGQYQRGLRVGIGRYVFSHSPSVEASLRGAVYHGDFRQDWIMGHGTMTFPNGMKYEGDWAFGKESGQGTVTWPDGRVLKGVFADGKIKRGEQSEMTRGHLHGSQSYKTHKGPYDETFLAPVVKYGPQTVETDEALDNLSLGGNKNKIKQRRRQSKRRQSKRRQSKRQQSKRH